eukprot:6206812-Pleurochrysis_carterae.AAC.1
MHAAKGGSKFRKHRVRIKLCSKKSFAKVQTFVEIASGDIVIRPRCDSPVFFQNKCLLRGRIQGSEYSREQPPRPAEESNGGCYTAPWGSQAGTERGEQHEKRDLRERARGARRSCGLPAAQCLLRRDGSS